MDYEVTDALREYDCGILEGRSDEAAWQAWQELFEAWTVHRRWEQRIEGGESFIDLRDRFVPFIENLVKTYAGSDANVVCVSHGGLYWMMLPLALKNVDADLIAQHGFGYTTRILVEPRPEGLFCLEWDGAVIAGSAGSFRSSHPNSQE